MSDLGNEWRDGKGVVEPFPSRQESETPNAVYSGDNVFGVKNLGFFPIFHLEKLWKKIRLQIPPVHPGNLAF